MHNEKLARDCEDDKITLCSECLPNHEDHKSVTLEAKREEVSSNTEPREAVARLLTELDQTTTVLQERVRSLDERTSETIKYINEAMDEVCLR